MSLIDDTLFQTDFTTPTPMLYCRQRLMSLFTHSASYFKRFATIIFSNSSSVLFFLALINSTASLPTKYLCSGLASVIDRNITDATSFGGVPFAIVENRFSSNLFINCEYDEFVFTAFFGVTRAKFVLITPGSINMILIPNCFNSYEIDSLRPSSANLLLT